MCEEKWEVEKKWNLNFIGGVINCDIYLNKYFGFEWRSFWIEYCVYRLYKRVLIFW